MSAALMSTSLSQERRMLNLHVSGPTGTGKSTLVRVMGSYPQVSIRPEPQLSDLLRRFNSEPAVYCFELQRTMLSRRVCGDDDPVAAGGQIRVWDRSPEEDFAIFATMFHTAGYLSSEQFAALREQAAQIAAALGGPDAFVLLTAEEAVLKRRLATVGAPSRVLSLLREQVRLYEAWFASLRAPRLVIDTSTLEADDLARRGGWVLSSLPQACKGEGARNSAFGLAWII
jgi:deoxyadenosine/deoxycytidine kinase